MLREVQRARLMSAVLRMACERGVQDLTASSVIGAAGVSRSTFYEIFDDLPDCLLTALDSVLAQARASIGTARREHADWSEGLRAGLAVALAMFDGEPELARVCLVEMSTIGSAGLRRRSELIAQLARAISEGGELASHPLPPMTAEAVAGGVHELIHEHLLDGPQPRVERLLNHLMSFIVLPYLGVEAAQRELERPPECLGVKLPRASAQTDGLSGLRIRLTGRTVGVLAAVAVEPDLSNRGLCARSGVTDDGQMSKLLSRLERLGLLENSATGMPKGAPNAWRLTDRGAQLEHATRGARELRVG